MAHSEMIEWHDGLVRENRHFGHDVVLITEAPLSVDQEFNIRRRRYLIMMSGRAFCVIAAVLVYHISGWLSAGLLVGACVLPWAAVLLANDRPAKRAMRFRRFLPAPGTAVPELTAGLSAATSGPKAYQQAGPQPASGHPSGSGHPSASAPAGPDSRGSRTESDIIDL